MVQGTLRRGLILALAVLGSLALLGAAGCGPGRQGATTDVDDAQELPAVRSLAVSAQAAYAEGDYETAAADLERALRLAPRDADLWYELAQVRRAQGQYAEAESLAVRSNSLSGADDFRLRRNRELIAQCREARGDVEGAREARQQLQ